MFPFSTYKKNVEVTSLWNKTLTLFPEQALPYWISYFSGSSLLVWLKTVGNKIQGQKNI